MATQEASNQPEQQPNIRIGDVCKRCGVKNKSTIYSWIATLGFPKPRRIGSGRIVLWSTAEIDSWLGRQPRSTAGDQFGRSGLTREQYGQARVAELKAHQPAAPGAGIRLLEGGVQ